jgi:hypothetical protein
MEGCPLAHEKVLGNCVNCPQVTDCVFLNIMKKLSELNLHLHDIEKQLQSR